MARETRYVHKDGQILWCVVTSVLVEGENDSEPYVINNLQDITEQFRWPKIRKRLFRAHGSWGTSNGDVKTDQVTWSHDHQILGLQDSESGMPTGSFSKSFILKTGT